MKKKFNFWLQIVTICLCICAIAVGVYSATTAQITASGKVGFVAHGCNVDVTGQIYGHAAGNKADGLPVKEAQAEDLNGGTAVQVRGNAQTLPIGDRYFSDMESNDGKPADIVITLTITNVSKFAVTAKVDETATKKPSDAITVSFDKTTADMQENGTATFKITISMGTTSGSYAEINPTGNNFSIKIEFERGTEEEPSGDGYKVTLNTAAGEISDGVMASIINFYCIIDGASTQTELIAGENIVYVTQKIQIGCSVTNGGPGMMISISTTNNEVSPINAVVDFKSGYCSSEITIESNVVFTVNVTQ